MSKLKIDKVNARSRSTDGWLYPTPIEALKITHGKSIIMVVGYAVGYNGEDGDVAEAYMCLQDFNKDYALVDENGKEISEDGYTRTA